MLSDHGFPPVNKEINDFSIYTVHNILSVFQQCIMISTRFQTLFIKVLINSILILWNYNHSRVFKSHAVTDGCELAQITIGGTHIWSFRDLQNDLYYRVRFQMMPNLLSAVWSLIQIVLDKKDPGPISPSILEKIVSLVLQIFFYLEEFECNTTSNWLNRTV